jgi:methyl-accepting chemotaxis protein
MKIPGWLNQVTLSRKLIIFVVLINICTSAAFSINTYHTHKKAIMEKFDAKLLACAQGVRLIADRYHDRIENKDSIPVGEYRQIQDKMTEFANGAGVTFVYAMMQQNGSIVYTGDSYTQEDKEKGEFTSFFDPYDDASQGVKDAFAEGKLHFDEYTDKWGTFRSVFAPFKTPNGTTYMIGVDIDLGDVKQALMQSLMRSLLLSFVIFVIATATALVLIRSLSRRINALVSAVNRVASGELNVLITDPTRDELGSLATDINKMAANLSGMIRKISETSNELVISACQVNEAAEDTESGARLAADQSDAAASASEEMAATSAEIAQNCSVAAEGAKHAADSATDSSSVVDGTIDIMRRIAGRVQNTSKAVMSLGVRSDQIGEIVGTIEDIADQTNLLALNAAIEAARAGEQGRGFAVVADEVRALADRTTRATGDITRMIRTIQSETGEVVASMEMGVKEVEHGMQESGRSGDALREILDQVSGVAMQINQIATAAEQQTSTTSEISTNIHRISDAVQSTVQGARQSASTAGKMNNLAGELRDLVGQFRL